MGLSILADEIKSKVELIKKVFAGASSFTQPGGFVKPLIKPVGKAMLETGQEYVQGIKDTRAQIASERQNLGTKWYEATPTERQQVGNVLKETIAAGPTLEGGIKPLVGVGKKVVSNIVAKEASKVIQKGKEIVEEVAPKISKEISPLIQEARKYKNAEEFVKASKAIDDNAPEVFWHGSASGDLRGGLTGLHIGTKKAATEALEARIGIRADGKMWDGTEEYGKTLLAGQKTQKKLGRGGTGYNVDAPVDDYYPTKKLQYGDESEMPMTVKPRLEAFKIKGEMSNSPYSPHDDWKANGYMTGNKKKGTAKRGYFYKNIAEDEGSISATVPNGEHLEPIKTKSQLTDIWNKANK